MPGSSSWMPYAPQGVKGFDDDLYTWMFGAIGCSDIGGTYLQTTRRHIPEHSYLHNHDRDSHQYHSSAIALKVGKSMEFLRENKTSHTDVCFAKRLEIPRRWKDNLEVCHPRCVCANWKGCVVKHNYVN